MRSLSSTLSDSPSRCEPSRRVVSKTSTPRSAPPSTPCTAPSADMFDPVLVAVDLAAHGGEEDLLDAAGDGAGLAVAHHPVVDRADGHDLGGGAGQERLVGGVEVAAQDVAGLDVDALVARDGEHR